jgi:hypothetical protein
MGPEALQIWVLEYLQLHEISWRQNPKLSIKSIYFIYILPRVHEVILHSYVWFACFDCDPSHEVMYGTFHMQHHVGDQNIFEFGAFWI